MKPRAILFLALPLFASFAGAAETGVRSGERLSDWILRQRDLQSPYLPGLQWRTPEQLPHQSRSRQQLLDTLVAAPNFPVSEELRRKMTSWIESLPVTGRVPLAMTDPRWLQAHPEADPVLDAGQSVRLPLRPGTVAVLSGGLMHCITPHVAGRESASYLRKCFPNEARSTDRVWLIQPDGRVLNIAIAAWNREAQSEPAPGAVIWAPSRGTAWPEWFSTTLAQFLATQPTGFMEKRDSSPHPNPSPQGREGPEARARSRVVSASDWGEIGLLQTPTARMADLGEMRFSYSRVYPYGRGNIMFQPLDWLEAGFRYTAVFNHLYGPRGGGQSYKDKSIDAKIRLAKETAFTPELAFGFIDLGGTGLFSSEYLVANKRWGDFDLSLGLGWGYLGSRGNVTNPLSAFGSDFKTRKRDPLQASQGGQFSVSSWFTGPTGLFGGVQYHAPWDDALSFKLELDGNDYRHEPFGYAPGAKTPLNFGLNYRVSNSFDVAAALERGNRAMLSFSFHGGLDRIVMPKLLDPEPVPVRAEAPAGMPDWNRTVADIEAQTLWTVGELALRGKELCVTVTKAGGVYWAERIERATRLLHRDAPANIERFVFRHSERGAPISEEIVLRDRWLAQHTKYLLPEQREGIVTARRPDSSLLNESSLWRKEPDWFSVGLTPSFTQTVGGPDGFFLFQAGVAARSEVKFSESTWAAGKLNLRLIDNYSSFKVDGPSDLPRVRTDLRKYLVTSRVTMPTLQLNHVGSMSENQFYSFYGGYLESMFAGAGGEWLYRPWQSPFAVGIDINRVKKRAFDQRFDLLDYSANTGHATLYWETGWHDINASLSAGQYLAGDKGATIDVHRRFKNGTVIGALATKTDVSATRFGEGSFDKGIYLSIPFDAILPQSSGETAHFNWHPLTRDGGAKLDRALRLIDFTRGRDRRVLSYREAVPFRWNGEDAPMPEPENSLFRDVGRSGKRLVRQVGMTPLETMLLGGGLVLASSLLDEPADKWAKKHQGGKWDTLASGANAIPLVLGAGAGLLWFGTDEVASDTAWTALKSAGFTLASETLLRSAVGRARPDEGLGNHHFDSFGSGATQSSFPSRHAGAAFALVTPFAQRYGANWLYAVAGATAFGRIQERQHFVSDTVAGGLIGYGIGSLMLEQDRSRNRPSLSIGPDRSLRAYWEFD